MDPDAPRAWFACAGVLIRRVPSAYSTEVCSAAFTSRPLEALAGRTVTVVSARSAAMIWTRPAAMSTRAEMAAGVSNFCMVLSSCAFFVSYNGKATLRSRVRQ